MNVARWWPSRSQGKEIFLHSRQKRHMSYHTEQMPGPRTVAGTVQGIPGEEILRKRYSFKGGVALSWLVHSRVAFHFQVGIHSADPLTWPPAYCCSWALPSEPQTQTSAPTLHANSSADNTLCPYVLTLKIRPPNVTIIQNPHICFSEKCIHNMACLFVCIFSFLVIKQTRLSVCIHLVSFDIKKTFLKCFWKPVRQKGGKILFKNKNPMSSWSLLFA